MQLSIVLVGKSSSKTRSAWRKTAQTVRRRYWRARRAKAWLYSRGCCCVAIGGRRLTVRYLGNGGIYPCYLCNWLRRDGLASKECMSFRCDLLDAAVSGEVLKALQ